MSVYKAEPCKCADKDLQCSANGPCKKYGKACSQRVQCLVHTYKPQDAKYQRQFECKLVLPATPLTTRQVLGTAERLVVLTCMLHLSKLMQVTGSCRLASEDCGGLSPFCC